MGTIAEFNELTAPAPEDYWVVRDVSDPLDKDKKVLLGKFPLKYQTPVAGRVVRWRDANTVEDGGVTLTGTGTIALGAFTLTVPATGTVNLNEVVQSVSAVKTFSAAPVFPVGITMATTTVSKDTAYSFSPPATNGLLFISHTGGEAAMIAYRTAATIFCTKIAGTANLNVMTGILSGTTGVDAKITVSTHTDGRVFVENRLIGTITIKYFTMG